MYRAKVYSSKLDDDREVRRRRRRSNEMASSEGDDGRKLVELNIVQYNILLYSKI